MCVRSKVIFIIHRAFGVASRHRKREERGKRDYFEIVHYGLRFFILSTA